MGIGAIAGSSLLLSCSDDWGTAANGSGRIVPTVDLDREMITSRSTDPTSRALQSRATDLTAADLSIRLTKTDGTGGMEWPKLSDFPVEKEFGVGQYKLEAFYGDEDEQGFDCPSYYGSQTITVEDGKTTNPTLTASMSKSMVTVKYTESFMNYMADWGAKVNGIEYVKGEDRAVYVTPGDVTVRINVTKPNGLGAEFTLDKVEAKAKYHYTITVDVNNGGVGDGLLNITFDDMMETEDITIDLSDELLSSPAPEIKAKGFESNTAVDVVSGIAAENVSMSLVAMANLSAVKMTTASPSLIKQGWPSEIELMSADEFTQAKLKELGLEVLGLWKNPGQMAVIDFSQVPVHSSGDEEATFTLTVKDQLMRESDATTLTFNIEKAAIELVSADNFYQSNMPVNVVIGFNGGQKVLKENIKIEYKNPVSGRWNELAISNVSEGRSRAMLDYTVTVTAPNMESTLTIRANYQGNVSNEISIDPYIVTADEKDTYSTYAFVRVVGVATPEVKVNITKDGDSAEQKTVSIENGFIKLESLEPATHYTVEVAPEGMDVKTVELTTENATQLENGMLEDGWSATATNNNRDWSLFTVSGWSTMNELTTSKGGNYVSILGAVTSVAGAGYVAMSGTQNTNDAAEGSTAALIQTVGWGASNGLGGRSGLTTYTLKCENSTAGELYLGHWDEDNETAVYDGMEISSRPAALKFSYKYEPKNAADWGVAEVHVLAADNSVIAEKTFTINEQSEYVEKELTLDYPKSAKKAARIQVRFKSSGNAECLYTGSDKNQLQLYYTYPTNTPVKTKEGFIGSKLYVDAIQLIY